MNGMLLTEPLFIETIEERKINTRRLVKPQPEYCPQRGIIYKGYCYGIGLYDNPREAYRLFSKSKAPKYKVGERVYLKEPYKVLLMDFDNGLARIKLKYSNTDIIAEIPDKDMREWCKKRIAEQSKSKSGYCNKMFMPVWCANHFIEITDVKCERLQDISVEDCIKEGIAKAMAEQWSEYILKDEVL